MQRIVLEEGLTTTSIALGLGKKCRHFQKKMEKKIFQGLPQHEIFALALSIHNKQTQIRQGQGMELQGKQDASDIGDHAVHRRSAMSQGSEPRDPRLSPLTHQRLLRVYSSRDQWSD